MPTLLKLDFDLSDDHWASMVGERCVLVLAPGPEFTVVRNLDDQEWDDYSLSFALLVSIKMARKLLDATQENYDEFVQAFNGFHLSASRAGDEAVRSAFDGLINRRLSNYLSSMRLFLDHVEYRLKRVYGKDSDQAVKLHQRCSELFDSVFAYRFAYKLRNYSQHFGSPIWDIEWTSSVVEGTTDELVYSARVEFSVPGLLAAGRDCWGPVQKDLVAMPPTLDVASVMSEVPPALVCVWATFLEVQRKYVEGIGHLLEEMLALEGPAHGDVVVGEWMDVGGQLALSFQPSPTELIRWVEGELEAASAAG
jgi:hypothetical protein